MEESSDSLSSEDYQLLPDVARAYGGCGENEFLRVSPPVLQFPRNEPSTHLGKLVLWNKTKARINFRLIPPQSQHFSIFCEKSFIFGGGEETIVVKVRPYDETLLCSSLRIKVMGSDGDELVVPIELLPNTSWFNIPKLILLPPLSVGKSFEVRIPLPKTEDEDGIHFFISHVHSNAITISPHNGVIGGHGGGTEHLLIQYQPREYKTLVQTLFLHFPSIQKKPFEITLFLRATPSDCGRPMGIPTFPPLPKQPTKPTKLKQKQGKGKEGEGNEMRTTEDLSSPGAIVKFLLRPAGDSASSSDITDVTGHNQYESHRNYKTKEKGFYGKMAEMETTQQNLHLQPSRILLGETLEEETEEIKAQREEEQSLYEKLFGGGKGDIDDWMRGRVKLVRRRALRDLDISLVPPMSKPDRVSTDPLRQHILRPFIQGALTLITRTRANNRIIKLRILINQRKETNI